MLDPSAPIPPVFEAVLSRWVVSAENEMAAQAVPDPIRQRFGELKAFRIYLGQVVVDLKVDAGKFASPMSDMSLTKDEPARIVARDFNKSKDFETMKKVVWSAHKQRSGS